MTTNLLPDLNTWEYDALKASIRRWKVILPVVKDENGDVIDGYQRVRVCNELGITDYPVLTLAGLSDDEKRDHAYVLDVIRNKGYNSRMMTYATLQSDRREFLALTGLTLQDYFDICGSISITTAGVLPPNFIPISMSWSRW